MNSFWNKNGFKTVHTKCVVKIVINAYNSIVPFWARVEIDGYVHAAVRYVQLKYDNNISTVNASVVILQF